MTRRAAAGRDGWERALPGAAELFRSTQSRSTPVPADLDARPGSGRQKHDAKITVYVSGEELVALERARLTARADHGIVTDRGRIVREAIAVLLADFSEHGADSLLVRRLRADPGE
ncbi:MAG TPA: hypothetical protein VGL06_28325 [Pseudonocardiaceae bacterium]